VALIAERLTKRFPGIKITNRGISGNRIADCAGRWKKDCLELLPSHVSLLIGINDTWRYFDSNEKTEIDVFEKRYREMLDSVKPVAGIALILCEPFLVPQNDDQKLWHIDLDPKRRMVRGLADEYSAIFVPLHDAFRTASKAPDSPELTTDGVHPADAGHALIADTWMKAVGL
jgi:lysophospholipase L1-like esterase